MSEEDEGRCVDVEGDDVGEEQQEDRPVGKDPVEELTARVNELEKERLYLLAEIENTRTRLLNESDKRAEGARECVAVRFLEVLDNFDRALTRPPEGEGVKDFVKGVEMIRAQMLTVFATHGIVPIQAEGNPFDPHIHEAVETVSEVGKEHNTVIEELCKGYMINNRVLRPARVRVNITEGGGAGKEAIDAEGKGKDCGRRKK